MPEPIPPNRGARFRRSDRTRTAPERPVPRRPVLPPPIARPRVLQRTETTLSAQQRFVALATVVLLIVLVFGVLVVVQHDNDPQTATDSRTTSRPIYSIPHALPTKDDVHAVVATMAVGQCWNAIFAWVNSDYVIVTIPIVVPCTDFNATAVVAAVDHNGDDCQDILPVEKSTSTHCFQAIWIVGHCMPARGEWGKSLGMIYVIVPCDSPRPPERPLMVIITKSLSTDEEYCDGADDARVFYDDIDPPRGICVERY